MKHTLQENMKLFCKYKKGRKTSFVIQKRGDTNQNNEMWKVQLYQSKIWVYKTSGWDFLWIFYVLMLPLLKKGDMYEDYNDEHNYFELSAFTFTCDMSTIILETYIMYIKISKNYERWVLCEYSCSVFIRIL